MKDSAFVKVEFIIKQRSGGADAGHALRNRASIAATRKALDEIRAMKKAQGIKRCSPLD